jgi:hypothetical protein
LSRIRTVKPELFLDEELGALTGDHALLFIGLWTLADKEGRLEDRPARIKASLFPYRPVDVDQMLNALAAINKLVRYDADGQRYIAIPGFTKHQRPHPKEVASVIPAPPTVSREKTFLAVKSREVAGNSPGRGGGASVGREGKGREGVSFMEAESPASQTAAAEPPQPKVRKPSDAEVFWDWADTERTKSHPAAIRESKPAPQKLNAWYKDAAKEVGESILRGAYAAFLTDSYATTTASPVCPFGLFMSQWTRFADIARKKSNPVAPDVTKGVARAEHQVHAPAGQYLTGKEAWAVIKGGG